MKLLNQTMIGIAHFTGLESNKTGHLEKWISATGGLVGILAVTFISQQFLGLQAVSMVVASMGATAVLVFAVPHGPLSQPWAVVGGHLLSAVIGVACARWIPDLLIASAVAVSLAIGSMHYLRCIHPPGGATALTAVIGGANLQATGFQYVLTPVLLNAVTIVIIAIVFNYAFSWRRYPASLAVRHAPAPASHNAQETRQNGLNENDLQVALQTMDSTIDISSQDLAHIYRLTQQNKSTTQLNPSDFLPGNFYSNGLFGSDWQVRQIIDMATPVASTEDLLIYKVVAGSDRRSTGTSSFEAFSKWASYEVFLNESSWQRKKPVELVYA